MQYKNKIKLYSGRTFVSFLNDKSKLLFRVRFTFVREILQKSVKDLLLVVKVCHAVLSSIQEEGNYLKVWGIFKCYQYFINNRA